jgi:hypothetical protein
MLPGFRCGCGFVLFGCDSMVYVWVITQGKANYCFKFFMAGCSGCDDSWNFDV